MKNPFVVTPIRSATVSMVSMVLALSACSTTPKETTDQTATKSSPAMLPVMQKDAATPPAPVRQPAVVIPGTGQLFANKEPAAATPPAAVTDGFQLNFVDADIAVVVGSIIGDGLGRAYSVDPLVKGTMTLQATRPLSKDEVLPALEAALALQGFALVESDGSYQVLVVKDAPKRVRGFRSLSPEGQAAGYAIQIVPVKYVSVVDIEKVLQPFAREGGILRIDENRNLLILAGSSQELASMLEVVQTFDVDWLAGMSFGMFPVEYVDAKTLVDELEAVLGGNKSPIGNAIRLIPIARLNSVMVITHQSSYLKEVETWIRRLDVGASSPGRRIYVYDVQNGKADDLADSLNKVMSLSNEQSLDDTDSTSRTSTSTSPSGTGSLTARSPGSRPQQSQSMPATSVNASGSSENIKIVPSAENNALLIRATPDEFGVIEAALKRLDVMPIQVLLEASLAEVSLNDDLRFGLQWAYQGGDGPIILSEASNGGINQAFPGFSYLFTGRPDIRAVLNAIETLTNVKVVSSPKLLVLNNHEASLQIGDQVPITVQSAIGTDTTSAPIVNSVQLRDTGVILRVTPRANKSGLVLLDIAQEVSDVVPTTSSSIDSPTIQQRKISSTIAVRDGETVALGGLIRDSSSRSRGGIPFISKIPLIGNLLGSTNNNSRRTELIVLITPRVMRSSQDTADVMDELRGEFRRLKKLLPQLDVPDTETK
jgi:general secretion pathway protein D